MKTRVLPYLIPAAALALFCASAQASDYPTTVLSHSPLGYWRLNETASSPAINKVANSGSVFNADGYVVLDVATGETGANAIAGNAIRLVNIGGTVGYCGSKVDVPFNPALNPNPPFSIEFWAKPNSLGGDTTGNSPLSCFNPNDYGGGDRSGWLFYMNNTGRWQFRLGLTSGYAGIVSGASSANATVGIWQHIVATYDGTTARLYVNGVQAGSLAVSQAATGWQPNSQMALRMGGTALTGSLTDSPTIANTGISGNRGFDGWLDEVAIYGTLLSATQVKAHFDAATTNNASYSTQILADAPLGYWNLNEPAVTPPDPATFPIAANSGTLGTDADGTNMWGSLAAQPGSGYAGLGAGNNASFFNGESGFIGLKDAAGLHFTGSITLMAWIKPRVKDFFRDIIAHGWDGVKAETFLRISRSDSGDGTGTTTNWYEVGSTDGTTYYDSALFPIPDGDIGNWVHLAGTFDGSNWNLYRNGLLVATAAPSAGDTGAIDTTNRWSIGSRTSPSATPPSAALDADQAFLAEGLFFGGSIDEPAIFSTALAAADINTIYNSAQVSPVITRAPVVPAQPAAAAGTLYSGSSASFSVWAEGSPTLGYLWTSNGISTGLTTTNIMLNNMRPGSPVIAVIVTNAYGSITSAVTPIVLAAPPLFLQQPVSVTRYNGRPFSFSLLSGGSQPFTYQWHTNGIDIPGATSASFTDTAVPALNGVAYSCTASNEFGTSNTVSVAVTVLPIPGGYAGVVYGDNPTAYWRLGETNGTVAHDYFNGNDGTYFAAALGQPGYSAIDPDTAVAFNGPDSYVGNISGTGINYQGHRNFSLEAWVNAPEGQSDEATVIAKGIGANGTTATEQFSLDVSGGRYHFYTRGGGNTYYEAFSTSGPDGTWQHLVGVYDDLNVLGAGTNLYIFVNGALEGQGGTRPSGLRASSAPVSIGSKRGGNDPSYNATFNGVVDEVATYPYALSNAQIVAHYSAAYGTSLKPTIDKEPVDLTVYESFPAKLSIGAFGTQPLTYQWHKGNTDLTDGGTISGASTRTLTIDPVSTSDVGSYSVTVNNSLGPPTNSVTVNLVVLKAPTNAVNVPGLVLHLPFDSDLNDISGRGNNGVGMHVTTNVLVAGSGATNTVSPSPGNPNFNFVADGVIGKGLHYATYTTSGSNVTSGGAMTNSHYVSLGKPADLNFGANVNFSIAYWIRFPAFNGTADLGDLPFLCSAIQSYGNPGFTFAPSYNLGSWSYSLNGNVQLYGPNYLIDDGVWHHLAHTFERGTVAITYLDGRQVDIRSDVLAGNLDTGNSISIGQDPTGSYQEQGYYDIDDLGVWRRALTALEVQSIYLAATNALSSYVDITPVAKPAAGGQLTITWQAGILQQADAVTGPYTDVSPQPASPFAVSPSSTKKFYRTRWLQ